eukprot:365442-Chlamydomonas_euryale.AAC.7
MARIAGAESNKCLHTCVARAASWLAQFSLATSDDLVSPCSLGQLSPWHVPEQLLPDGVPMCTW